MTTPVAVQRKLAPDIARGAMLLLIAMSYALSHSGMTFASRFDDASAADTVTKFAIQVLLHHRSFPMFAILFGYGLAWMVAKQRRSGAPDEEIRRQLRRRGLWLLGLGSAHAVLVYPAEILGSYGLAALALSWLLFRSDQTLTKAVVWFAAAYAVVLPLLTVVFVSMSAYTPGSMAPGYATTEDWLARLSALANPLVTATGWPLFLLVALGFVAARRGLLDDPAAHVPLLRRIAVGGITVSVLGAVPYTLVVAGVLDLGPVPASLLLSLHILTGVCGGAGYVAVFGLLALRLGDRRGPVTVAVAAVGQRSLTVYLFDSLVIALLLNVFGLGAHLGAAEAVALGSCVWLVATVLAVRLDQAGRPGPADAYLRRLIYRNPSGTRVGAGG